VCVCVCVCIVSTVRLFIEVELHLRHGLRCWIAVVLCFLFQAAHGAPYAPPNHDADVSPLRQVRCSALQMCDSTVLLTVRYCTPCHHCIEKCRGTAAQYNTAQHSTALHTVLQYSTVLTVLHCAYSMCGGATSAAHCSITVTKGEAKDMLDMLCHAGEHAFVAGSIVGTSGAAGIVV
jgi:hypothetical protein